MCIEGERFSQDSSACQKQSKDEKLGLLTPSSVLFLLYHLALMKYVQRQVWRSKLVFSLNDLCNVFFDNSD